LKKVDCEPGPEGFSQVVEHCPVICVSNGRELIRSLILRNLQGLYSFLSGDPMVIETRGEASMMETHRIVLAHDSRLLRGMLRHAIDKAPGLEVVGEISDLKLLLSTVEKKDPHWAITSLSRDGRVPEIADRVLDECSSVSILAVAIDGSLAKVKGVARREQILGCLSLEQLISVLVENSDGSEGEARPKV
jgi:hypothetical protein